MRRLGTLAAATALALVLAGCGHLEVNSEGDSSRALVGQVDAGQPRALPADAVVTVRVVVPATASLPGQVLGAQTIKSPGVLPVDFRVEYQASDELLRHGLNVEARVSWGGVLRYYNRNGYAVSLSNASDPHRIGVDPVGP